MDVLSKKHSKIAKKINEINIDEINERIRIQFSQDGQNVLSVYCRDHWWGLNSMVSPEAASGIYANRYTMRMYGLYFVYGFSDGRSIRYMLEKSDETNCFVIWEPDIEILAMACHCFDISDLLDHDRIFWCVPQVEDNIENILQTVVTYLNMKLIEFCILPNYDVIYTRQCEQFMQSCTEKLQDEVIAKCTRLGFGRMIPQHILYHMKNMISQRNIAQIKQAFSAYPVADIPVIIVSAGPSLDKNVKELRKAQGKAFIIVVDAALRTVLQAGVQPDIVCTIDPESPERFFEGLELKNIIWAYGRWTRPWIFEKYGGSVFYQGYYSGLWNAIMSDALGYEFPQLVSGGSVTADAFMLADYIGFRKIILVGQDMAFTNGISHTSGIDGAFGDNDDYINSRYLVSVQGIHGEELKTDFQMWRYKKWFEKIIRMNGNRFEVINATEGGACIEGTVNRTLCETIETECQADFDGYNILKKLKPSFSREKQQTLQEKLLQINEEAQHLCKMLEKNIKDQKELLDSLKTEKITDNAEILRQLKLLIEQNALIERNGVFEFLVYYAQKEEYDVGDDIYTDENMKIEDMIQKSIYLMESYLKGTRLFENDIKEYALKF